MRLFPSVPFHNTFWILYCSESLIKKKASIQCVINVICFHISDRYEASPQGVPFHDSSWRHSWWWKYCYNEGRLKVSIQFLFHVMCFHISDRYEASPSVCPSMILFWKYWWWWKYCYNDSITLPILIIASHGFQDEFSKMVTFQDGKVAR